LQRERAPATSGQCLRSVQPIAETLSADLRVFEGEARPLQRKHGAALGCDHYVNKLQSPLQLLRRIRALLDGLISPSTRRPPLTNAPSARGQASDARLTSQQKLEPATAGCRRQC